ncbi:MAG: 1A family penicillin-binding protein [Candidatus Magasanikbacteria bacterium]|nr:1A family penicillin-binding protein [Candidatus Magasanikbacteria bacterium]
MPLHRIYGSIDNNSDAHHKKQNNGRLRQHLATIRNRLITFNKPGGPRLPRFNWRNLLRKLIPVVIVLGIAAFFVFTIFVAWASKDLPDPDKLQDRVIAQTTKIYDRTGEHLLYEIFSDKKRTLIELKGIPDFAIKATIAVEDKHFFEHKGIRWLSIMRAGVANVLRLSSGRGGASTLTQQLVKNAIVGNERSFLRKVKEAILSMQIERKFSKDQILKLYFNEIPYGSTNYGIEAAAQSYFGKSARDLTLPEAATLAALPQAPSRYLNNLQVLKSRRNLVLDLMSEQKYISADEAKTGKETPLFINPISGKIFAPHFVLGVKAQLVEQFGEKLIEQGGLKIITTLDYDKQKIAEEEIKKGVEATAKYKATNGALVALDPKTGQVLAMVGSNDFFDKDHDGQFNVATQGLRQPGSSFKPIVYAAAFQKGFTPETVLYDVETVFPYDGKTYNPHNYDGKEHGSLTMRQALQGSLNIPAVKTVFLVGVQNALDLAEKFGYSTFKERSNFGPSIVLGGGGVKLIEHTGAYAALANDGVRHDPVSVLRVEDEKNNVLYEWQADEGEKVMEPDLAHLVTSVLSDNGARAYIFGEKNFLTLGARPAAAKSGTTNNNHDAWTMGYTPSLAAGVWLGNNDNSPMKKGADGSIIAAPIWNTFMKRALEKSAIENFSAPPPNTAEKPILRGETGGKIIVDVNKLNGRIATSSTPPELIESKIFYPAHDILWYVNRDVPNGPPPTDPLSDELTAAFETGVQNWVKKKQDAGEVVELGDPPTEKDEGGDPALRPNVEILTPVSGVRFSNRNISATVKVSAPAGVARVVYTVDGKMIAEYSLPPFALNAYVRELGNGPHTLSARAFDDQWNGNEASLQFTLEAPDEPPAADIVSVGGLLTAPGSVISFKSSATPIDITLKLFRREHIKQIKIFISRDGVRTDLATISSPAMDTALVKWTPSSIGVYELQTETMDGTGHVYAAPAILASIN